MFYDFECMQETSVHKVNLAVVHDFEGNEWIFNTIGEFCDLFLLKNTKAIHL